MNSVRLSTGLPEGVSGCFEEPLECIVGEDAGQDHVAARAPQSRQPLLTIKAAMWEMNAVNKSGGTS